MENPENSEERLTEFTELAKKVIETSTNSECNPNGAETSTCPFCYGSVKYMHASMHDIEHDPKDCAWLLAKDLLTNID